MIEISNYNASSLTHQLHSKIINRVKLSDDVNSASRENAFIKDICKRVKQSKTVLYVIEDDNESIGLIAISTTSFEEQPSLQIDYIFVNDRYRGVVVEELDNCKPFRYLVGFAINIANEIKTKVGLRYLLLSPDSDELKEKYKQVDFKELNDDWMYFKLK